MHTNIRVMVPFEGVGTLKPSAHPATAGSVPPYNGYFYETPASLACVYKLVPTSVTGCNPNTATLNATGGTRAIAIVDAYHYSAALSDLSLFSTQFGLPAPNLTVVYATGKAPQTDPTGGWEVEEALDLQWAHAMAPHAKLYLVEAASSNLRALVNCGNRCKQLGFCGWRWRSIYELGC